MPRNAEQSTTTLGTSTSTAEIASAHEPVQSSSVAAAPDAGGASFPNHVGRYIEGRFELLGRIDGGAHGDVWEAEDRIVGERVALKWIRAVHGPMLASARREITTLRLLRFPGVVRFIDEGVADEKPFIVMELVDGRPFPGGPKGSRPSWESIAKPTLALLETLSHVHAAGVIHRDLKPQNVLVRSNGSPVVLDFGISQLHSVTIERVSGFRHGPGTPLYMAPEQILGAATDARTDLYAIGAMIYEALTGQAPHQHRVIGLMFNARLSAPARPVQDLVPTLPSIVASVIDRLLATRMEDRFESAADVLAALRGESMTAGTMLPFLGSRKPLHDIVDMVGRGQSIDIVGPRGSGRTRWLREIGELLLTRGKTIALTQSSRAPLESLLPALGEPTGAHDMRLEQAKAWMESELERWLSTGKILLVDDAEELDSWSAEIVDRFRVAHGGIIRTFLAESPRASRQGSFSLSPLDSSMLEALFGGPDRLFHLREDAARALFERTDGWPAQFEMELQSWTRLGLVHREGGTFHTNRDCLDRIRAGLVTSRIMPRADLSIGAGDTYVQQALRWLSMARCPLSIAQLGALMQCAPFRAEAAGQALLRSGAIKRRDDDRFELRGRIQFGLDEHERGDAHRAIASILPAGEDIRLHHLLAAELMSDAAREAMEVAKRRAMGGNIGEATAFFAEGLRAARTAQAIGEEKRLLMAWAKTALADGTARALDRILYELTRVRNKHPELTRLELLLRAAIAAPGASGIHALEVADELGTFADPELERWRHRIRVTAVAVRASAALIAEVLDEVEAWEQRDGEPLAQLCLAESRARQRYHEGRFEEAAELYSRSAQLETSMTARVEAMLRSSSALLEAFRHEDAARVAEGARSIAMSARMPYWEGRAEWLIRSAHYRLGKALQPDLELVDAVTRIGAQDLEALICLNEAAVAMRAGTSHVAQALADRAATIWRAMDRPFATMLARALVIACGGPTDEEEVESLANRAVACKGPGIGIQTLGLLGRASPRMRPQWQWAIAALVEDVPESKRDQRMDVLSMNEAVAAASIDGREPG